MNIGKISPKLATGILLALIFGVALWLRAVLPYDQVFSGDWIKFTGIDAYYHMRIVDNLALNFPSHMSVDPYRIYPGAPGVVSIRFFDWLLASSIWVIGLGTPTKHLVDIVGVYFPAVLGALTVIPVYFIGKELFGRGAGMLSAGLIAILPGEIMGRSILGFTDHHIAEILFSATTILFLILAIKNTRRRQLTFSHFKRRDWSTSAKPVIYSLLAGIFLGIYILTWLGGLLFVFIIALYFTIQFIIDHLKHQSTDYLVIVGVVFFFIALVISLPSSPSSLQLASLIIALLIPLVLNGISRILASWELKPAYYPLTLVGLGLAGLGLLHLISSSLLGSMINAFDIFMPRGAQLTTIEMQPLFFPGGTFSFAVAWGNFTTSFYLGFISLALLIYLVIKQGSGEKNLLVVWSVVILAATIGQRRFAYYFAVNVALLTGFLSVLIYYIIQFIIDYLGGRKTDYSSQQILKFTGFPGLIGRPEKQRSRIEMKKAKRIEMKKAKRRQRPETATGGLHLTARPVAIALGIIVIFFLVFYPITGPSPDGQKLAIDTASQARFAPTNAWMNSLTWLKENTPDPFDNPDFYYESLQPPPLGESYKYPESAYGVLSWWDYGYWITRIAHRIPNTNPSQDPRTLTSAATFFTSQDENSANEIAQDFGSAYVIIDTKTATSKFHAVITWAGKNQAEFFDVYLLPEENQVRSVQLFYPEYYNSISSRLYNFDGQAVTPERTLAVSYQEQTSQDTVYKVITDVRQFDNYQEAEAFVSSQESPDYRIVSDDPFTSPVPLEALGHYKLIHGSAESVGKPDGGTISAVKIFQYID